METSSQSAVCKQPFLYSNEQSKKKHTPRATQEDTKQSQDRRNVSRQTESTTIATIITQTITTRQQWKEEKARLAGDMLAQCKQNKPESQPTLFPKHRLIEFMFLFMSSLCLPTNLLSSHPHQHRHRHSRTHASTFHPGGYLFRSGGLCTLGATFPFPVPNKRKEKKKTIRFVF